MAGRFGFQKPENALKRAMELEKVEQPAMAWSVLKEQLNSKKHRSAWSSVHEKMMMKFIDLSVLLQKQPDDGLKDFKQISATTAVSSMGNVVRYFLDAATARVEKAQAMMSESMAVVDAVEDLEETITPEEMLLAAVSDDDAESRTHKAMLMPWVKYLWEAYRAVLEVLRNNNKLEDLYQEVAQRAFGFCHKFQRRNEFGRLVDQLRRHFNQAIKYQNQTNSIDLANPVTLQLLLETRFEQLNTAIKMDLWKVAFTSIEDIHNLMDEGPKAPKPLMVAEYYKKLAMIFHKSGNYQMHATALQKLFLITKEHNKKFSGEAAQQMAAQILLATLAVPVEHPDLDILKVQVHMTTYAAMENAKARVENARKMCLYAGINAIPTREDLMQSMISMNIIQYVPPDLKELFNLMEQEFQPLKLASKVAPILKYVEETESLSHYTEPLKQLVLLRLIKQLSQVYTTIKVARLAKLIPFLTPVEIEKHLVNAVMGRTLVFRLNHRENSLVFGSTLLAASDEVDGGARLESPQTGVLRGQMSTLSKRLREAVLMIDPGRKDRSRAAQMLAAEGDLQSSIEQEHDSIIKRKRKIEKLKEEQEAARLREAKEEKERREKEARERQAAEEARKAAARKAREEAEEAAAAEAAKLREKKAIIDSIRISEIGKLALQKHSQSELEAMPIEKIYKIQEEYQKKQEDIAAQKLQAQERKLDYFERAKRKEEIPLLEAAVSTRKAEWIAKSKAMHAERLEAKGRLLKMVEHQKEFASRIMGERQAKYEKQMEEFHARLREQRERERAEREAEERRQAEEKAERQREEERKEAELREFEEQRMARERKKKEEAEAERQRVQERIQMKEKELAEREQSGQREESGQVEPIPDKGPQRPSVGGPTSWRNSNAGGGGGGGGGGWRERMAARQQGVPRNDDVTDNDSRLNPENRGTQQRQAYRPPGAREERPGGGSGAYRAPGRRDDGNAYRPPARRDDGNAYRPPARRDNDRSGGGGGWRS